MADNHQENMARPPMGALFRKSLFEHPLLCPLSLKIGEDLLQVTQLAMRSHLVAMTPQTVYHYIKRETSAINSRQLPSDIRQGDEILFVETMLHLQKKASTRRMRTECRLLSLFAVLNLPSSGYRSKLLHHFRTLYLSYLLTDRHLIKTLWNISPPPPYWNDFGLHQIKNTNYGLFAI